MVLARKILQFLMSLHVGRFNFNYSQIPSRRHNAGTHRADICPQLASLDLIRQIVLRHSFFPANGYQVVLRFFQKIGQRVAIEHQKHRT
jgi:hypothetical protein